MVEKCYDYGVLLTDFVNYGKKKTIVKKPGLW